MQADGTPNHMFAEDHLANLDELSERKGFKWLQMASNGFEWFQMA